MMKKFIWAVVMCVIILFGATGDHSPPVEKMSVAPVLIDDDAIPKLICGRMTGTGVYISSTTVITASHVVASDVCTTPNGREFTIRSIESENDFAVLRTSPANVQPYRLNCDGFIAGETYEAGGYANGRSFRSVALVARNEMYEIGGEDGTFYALNGRVEQGMSGGPIVNSSGEIVGIISAVRRDNRSITLAKEIRDTVFCAR
jgi:S1-C subfamily serine protease